jgi:hypothetical protein
MKTKTWFCLFVLGALLLLGTLLAIPARAQSVLYVDWQATGANDGTSWDDAFADLQPALTAALPGDEIWVAEGTYKPTLESSPGEPRTATFQLKNGVALYGGFDPTDGAVGWADRDWQANPTTLSGDIGTAGDPADNSYHVLTGSGTDATAILDGFTITGGAALGPDGSPPSMGGGMYNAGGSPTLANVIFTGNTALWSGAGMYNNNSSPTLTDCTFTGNGAPWHGGGMDNTNHSSPTLIGCLFAGNSAYWDGGGMWNETYSSPTLTDCTFSGNHVFEHAGGMWNSDHSSPTLTNVIFNGNHADKWGGGMLNGTDSSPTLTDCTFADNSALNGGAMYNDGSSPELTNVTFSGNDADWGGGMQNTSSSPTLTNVTFSDNQAMYGGGMYNTSNSSPQLTNATFSGNHATVYGGGMRNDSSSPVLTDVTFSGNQADGWGGGMYNVTNSSPTLTNVTFSGNLAMGGGGGGIHNGGSSPVLTNVTFSGNQASGNVGVGMSNENSSPTLTNCILWGGTGQILNLTGGTPTVSYSDIQGGYTGTGNIDADPRFTDADGPDNVAGTDDDDLRLRISSPAIDAGDNTAVPGGVTTDLAGNPRFVDALSVTDSGAGTPPIVDMGAYEHQFVAPPSILYVDAEAAGANDGTSWPDAFVDLQDALAWAVEGVEIWVAEGIYLPTSDGDRMATFQLVSGVAVYGGFAGGESGREERDWTAQESILSGDIGTPGVNTDNSYHVVTGSATDATAILDGFTVTGSRADDPDWPHNCGGGMYNNAGSPTVTNVTFSGNTVTGNGAGMGNFSASPALTNCTFTGNSAGTDGGGMYNYVGSSPSLTNCTFESNSAGADGGGMYSYDGSSPVLVNCTFSGNTASSDAGGMYNYRNSSPVLTNVTFSGNNAAGTGGGMHNTDSSSPTLTNVTFSSNRALHGGGMFNLNDSSPTLIYCGFDGNNADYAGGGMYNSGSSSPLLAHVTLTNNTAVMEGGGMYNLDHSSPTLTDCTFSGNSAPYGGGAMYNYNNCSPSLTNVTFRSNDTNESGGGMWNRDFSSPTLTGCSFISNSARYGGGIQNWNSSSPLLTNVTVSGNTAVFGGGMYNSYGSNPTLANCTFSGNSAPYGGGMYNETGSSPIVTNCILWGGTGQIINSADSSPTVSYSDIQGGYSGIGNIDADPLLGQLADNGGATQTYALLANSPARDAGDPAGCEDPAGAPLVADQRGMVSPRDGDGDGVVRCDMGAFEAGAANDAWTRAQTLDLSSGPATVYEYVDQLGQSRWYKFQVSPGSRVTAEMVPANANLDIALFGDIQAAYDELVAPSGESDLVQLNAEFAADALSPFAYSPFAYSPFAYSPFAYSPFAYSPFAYSPVAYSPFAYSPFAYSPFAYSPFAYSPFAYSPFAYSPFAYSPFAYSPFAYSPEPDYSSAQMQSLMAISAFDGTAGELIEVNTWDNRGEFYLQVSGRNGAFDLSEPFMLRVTQDPGICAGVDLITRSTPPAAPGGGYQALFLTDWDRFDQADPDLSVLQSALPSFAAAVGGTVVDVGLDAFVQAANAEADATPQCPYAKNQVAWLIKDIVTAYRDAGHPVDYVVLVGSDDVIPFFRYPDRAELGSEKDYKPPVLEGTSSYASLTLGYVLSQDAYGSSFDLALNNSSLPIPDLAVGRLVETPADIMRMLEAYTLHGGSLTPASALVTGYDFLADAAGAIASELGAGLDSPSAVTSLVSPQEVSPADREGTPPLEAAWPSSMLRDLLLGARHDLIFLAGHFTAQGALAADYETRLWASELLDPSVDLENALVYSAGCHSGYNVLNQHGVPYVTVEPDWAQAFAQAGATFIGGTGYQYGDTDFLEYSERLYLEFTRKLRCGGQPMSVGQALVEAKQAYLAGTAQMRGIHEKALLEATLFGLPMLQVVGLSDAGCAVDPGSIVGTTAPYTSGENDPATPGEMLGLQYADVTVTSNLTLNTVPLRSVTVPDEYVNATQFSGTDGAVTNPAEPVLPLERRNVDVPDYVLRGVGFRGGEFADLRGMIPLTGAATTETRSAHTPFQSDIPYPLQPWSVNYFAQLADPASGITWLDVTPAQFVSDAGGDRWTGTWRRFDDMEFRLFYSNHTATLAAGAVPSLAAPPAILQVLAFSGTDEVRFQVRVAGDLAAGVQEVWVTYTGIPCEGGTACWQSLDLAQNADDSTLWQGVLSTVGVPASQIQYMVQAVNGVGLVSLLTNEGHYFEVDVDPADPGSPAEPAPGGEPATPAESTSVEFQSPPTSGAYSTEATFSAVLRTSSGAPVEGQRLTFALGAQQRSALTDGTGSATVTLPLHGTPADYSVSAIFAGGTGYLRSSAASPFTIVKQGAVLTILGGPGLAQYGDDALMTAELTDAGGGPMGEMTVLFLLSGEGQSYVVPGITDFLGRAALGRVPLPLGSYQIQAYFGQAVTVSGQSIDLTHPHYEGASASGTLVVGPEDANVTYTGETIVPQGSTTLNLAATVTQADDGAPGDPSLAWVYFVVRDQSGNWIADQRAQAASDGTVAAALTDLRPGTYQVEVAVFGGYFASNPTPVVTGVSLHPEPVEVGTPVSGLAYFIDPDSPLEHTATWDWGDGATCDTSVGGQECTLIEPSGSTPGEVAGSHAYTEPGVYAVRLAVTDGDAHTDETVHEFMVVYSLEGGEGFVTGGGWIWSQAGWCQLDDGCAAADGKANFGFVSRYKKGANAPTGTTEFSFSAGGLNFHSDTYQWLVVNRAATNAQFKGSGTVNGGASPYGDLYKFMIWAGDGEPDGDDTFRIKIWYDDDGGNEVVVYDNGSSQAIDGGSIVIHTKD